MMRIQVVRWLRKQVVPFVVIVAMAALVVVAFVASELAEHRSEHASAMSSTPREDGSRDGGSGGEQVFNFVENLPVAWGFYAAIGGAALAYLVFCNRRRTRLIRKNQDADGVSAEFGDRYQAVHELRRRALSSRVRAEVLLGGVIASLFVGLYASIYVSPHVSNKDRQVRIEATVQERYRSQIDALAKGQYWLRIATETGATGVPSLETGLGKEGKELILEVDGHRSEVDGHRAIELVSRDHGFTWTRKDMTGERKPTSELLISSTKQGRFGPITEIARLADDTEITVAEYGVGGNGLIATTDGSAHVTADGGENWKTWTRQELQLNSTEWIVHAVVGETGPLLVVGDEGSVSVFAGSWIPSNVELQAGATAFEFGANGHHGLIATTDGSAHVTADGGKKWRTWTRQELQLNSEEWIVHAVVGETGPRLVVGDEGSVSVFAGSWIPSNVELRAGPTAFEFGANGHHGLIATTDGSAHVTADGGENWKTWTRQELQLNSAEWIVHAVVGETGPRLVVGDEGSVSVFAGSWIPSNVELRAGPTAFEFGANGHHGLIATTDGSAHVTADGGENWKTWTRQELQLDPREWIVHAVVGETGPRLVVGDEGSIIRFPMAADSGETRERSTRDAFGLAAGEWENEAVVDQNGLPLDVHNIGPVDVDDSSTWTVFPKGATLVSNDEGDALLGIVLHHVARWEIGRVLARTDTGNVWFKSDKGWVQPPQPDELDSESVVAMTLDEGGNPIVVGNKGSVYTDREVWQSNSEFPSGKEEEAGEVAVASLDGTLVIAAIRDDEVAIYHNKRYSYDDTESLVEALPKESALRQDIGIALLVGGSSSAGTSLEEFGLDQTFWMRFVAMAATIYFVQLLVRLYQYSIRLAAFFDSRADAILLSSHFGDHVDKPSFYELVAAIGPESLDLKPPRFSFSSSTTGSKES